VIAAVRTSARAGHAWFSALLLACLTAFGWQSFVTQTHVHPVPVVRGQAASTSTQRILPGRHVGTPPIAPDRPIDCPICHDAAIAGHYLSPGPVLILITAITLMPPVAVRTFTVVPGRHRHGWRSRAPPVPSTR
jgi:hypothetical protein